jgi:hypothetical protein
MMDLTKYDTIERHAVRILLILYFCRDHPDTPSIRLIGDDTHVIETEGKLQKIDFWIRYPDHLAAALLRGCEPEGEISASGRTDEVKNLVREIFREQEPVLRWVPMLKYLRGAYEPLDNVMVFLTSRNLAYRRIVEKRHRTRYILTRKGYDAVQLMLQECPETRWYADRCQIINSFFGHLNSFEIRQLQYLEGNYAATPYREMIVPVEAEVRRRFERLFGEPL